MISNPKPEPSTPALYGTITGHIIAFIAKWLCAGYIAHIGWSMFR